MKKYNFSFLLTFLFCFSALGSDLPKVLLEEIKPLQDKKKIIIPVKVEAKIQSLATADIEGNVTKILKPLGALLKTGDIVLYLENKDPAFTYAAVPVRSPIDGVLGQIWTSEMSKVNRGDKLFSVINPHSLKLAAEFSASDLLFIRSGLKGEFKLNLAGHVSLGIKVEGISPMIDGRTGTASASLLFTSPQNKLPPIGSIGQAIFEISQGSIILIPEASLLFQDGKPMVRIVNGKNQFSKKNVELGEQRDSNFIIKSGIKKGDKIIVRSSRPLKEGELFDIEPGSEKSKGVSVQ